MRASLRANAESSANKLKAATASTSSFRSAGFFVRLVVEYWSMPHKIAGASARCAALQTCPPFGLRRGLSDSRQARNGPAMPAFLPLCGRIDAWKGPRLMACRAEFWTGFDRPNTAAQPPRSSKINQRGPDCRPCAAPGTKLVRRPVLTAAARFCRAGALLFSLMGRGAGRGWPRDCAAWCRVPGKGGALPGAGGGSAPVRADASSAGAARRGLTLIPVARPQSDVHSSMCRGGPRGDRRSARRAHSFPRSPGVRGPARLDIRLLVALRGPKSRDCEGIVGYIWIRDTLGDEIPKSVTRHEGAT